MKLADGALAVMRTGGPSMTEVVPLSSLPRKAAAPAGAAYSDRPARTAGLGQSWFHGAAAERSGSRRSASPWRTSMPAPRGRRRPVDAGATTLRGSEAGFRVGW